MAWHSGKPADNDFLSASVQHIRENFAELEPLQPHVAELVDLTALHPYIDALLSSRIVDHNLDVPNPPNGYYVRWENGMQLCFGTHDPGSVDLTAPFGTLFISTVAFTVTWPAVFTVVDATSFTPIKGSGAGPFWVGAAASATTVNQSYRIFSAVSLSGQTPDIGFVALGRWA